MPRSASVIAISPGGGPALPSRPVGPRHSVAEAALADDVARLAAEWEYLTIPPRQSAAYNENPILEATGNRKTTREVER
ncbi:MAG: hypothetical protein OYK82_11895 [Gammaproteobacteria bacterium]|nr:hypothetical protein [Gammaproteobacteria bacterium]